MDAACALLTVDAGERVDVCLLSRTEVEATPSWFRIVAASTKARRNPDATGRATSLALAANAGHYLAVRARRIVEEEGAMAVEREVERAHRDDLSVEMQLIRFRVEERLAVEERWNSTRRLLASLAAEDVRS